MIKIHLSDKINKKMAYRQNYYNTEEIDYQRHPVPVFEPPTLQIDHHHSPPSENELQNNFYHSSTELHRFSQNADRYTSNVRISF